MHDFTGVRIGFAMTGSFCTFQTAFTAAKALQTAGASLLPVMSEHAAAISTRFGTAEEHIAQLSALCGCEVLRTIEEVEPIGPKQMTDIMVIAPCTGNTLAKLACGITDTAVTMAVKSHLRGGKPVLLAIATNDALAGSARNIGQLLNRRHYYFVPFAQDSPGGKPASLVAEFTRLPEAVAAALRGEQLQPLLEYVS